MGLLPGGNGYFQLERNIGGHRRREHGVVHERQPEIIPFRGASGCTRT